MTFSNPTSLRVGMEGRLRSTHYRVAGRVVLGVRQEGETYCWQEFNLVSRSGETATLVYEPTDAGGDWRFFTLFEPEYPLTAEDAATKRVADVINLEGADVRVTMIDTSHVFHIEGEAPEGVEVGDIAHYFNAEGEGTRIVVSWTGNEVECYRGEDLDETSVRSAFNLPAAKPSLLARAAGGQTARGSARAWMTVLVLFLAVVSGFAVWSLFRSGPPQPGLKARAPALPMALGRTWKVRGTDYALREHSLVEVAAVGRRFERHEFQLVDPLDNQRTFLLVYGTQPGRNDWVLFTPLQPAERFTPVQAASKVVGERITIDGTVARVNGLFQTVIRQTDSAEQPDSKTERILYGFSAQADSTEFLARWNNQGITFYRGAALAAKEVLPTAGTPGR